MPTTGILLKKQLGLEGLKEVRISRFVVSSYKVLGVFFDSYRDMLVTTYRIKRFPRVATIFSGTDLARDTNRYTPMTPPVDIEDYNGTIRGALVIPVDLAGDRFIDEDEYSKIFESKDKDKSELVLYIPKETLKEITLYDLADKGNISDFSMLWRKDRNRIMGTENTTAKLIDCIIDEADKSVTFQFLTESTELGNKEPNDNIDSSYRFYDGPKGEVDPDTFRIKRNRSRTYELQIKIVDALEWIKVFEGEEIGQKEMKEILEVSDVKVFSTAPAFHWQGMNVNISQLDASIYPTDIPNPVWGPRHGDAKGYFLDKHLYGLFNQIKFFINPMSSMLSKKLKSRGLI